MRDFYGQYKQFLNKDVVCMQSNAMPNNQQHHFKNVFLTLFKPSETIQKEINEFKQKQIGRNKLVCSHIRVGKNPSMKESNYNDLGMSTNIIQSAHQKCLRTVTITIWATSAPSGSS